MGVGRGFGGWDGGGAASDRRCRGRDPGCTTGGGAGAYGEGDAEGLGHMGKGMWKVWGISLWEHGAFSGVGAIVA